MRTTRLIGIFVLCCATALAIVTFRAWMTQEQTIVSSGEALVGGPFELTDHTGKTVRDSDFTGKYMLIYFGYTFCPDICPAELQVMSAALDGLGNETKNIQPIFVTIDPERDTVAVMADYMGHFHPNMIGLTGTQAQITAAAKAYRVYFAKAPVEGSIDYLMDHSSIVFLMDRNGKFLKHFAYGTSVDDMVTGIRETIGGS